VVHVSKEKELEMQRYQTVLQFCATLIDECAPVSKIEEVLYVVANHGHGFMTIGEETYEITWQGHEQVSVRALAFPSAHQVSRGAW
jgi:hypothetical protein